jgi:hypothetical protein
MTKQQVALFVALSSSVVAAPTLAAADATINVDTTRDKMVVLTDGKDHYITVVPYEMGDNSFFYGDGKKFYSVPVRGGGSERGKRFDITFVDPRYYTGFQEHSSLDFRDGKYTVSCGERTVTLNPVEEAQAKTLLKAATFEGSPRKRKAYALARDTEGKYYFVDTGRTPETAKSFRLFVGTKGNLKLQKMTNVVSDSEGDIFATKTGSLRMILNKTPKESSWVVNGKPGKLLLVPVEDNIAMIYNELGVYSGERLGTPCDDL